MWIRITQCYENFMRGMSRFFLINLFMNTNYFKEIYDGLENTIAVCEGEKVPLTRAIDFCIERIRKTNNSDGLMFFCGNGASATMAEHMSHDWFQNGKINTYTCSETAHITAISNDLSYEDVFAYRVERMLTKRDILVTISASGNSANIIKAIWAAKKKGAFVITVSGKSPDNTSVKMGNLVFYVPLDTYGLVESSHAVLLHCILDEYLDKYMGGRH